MNNKVNNVVENDNKYVSITQIAPDNQKPNVLFECDNCKSDFEYNSILLEKCDNIKFHGLSGVKTVTKENDTYYLVSPCCKHTHLFGFNVKTI